MSVDGRSGILAAPRRWVAFWWLWAGAMVAPVSVQAEPVDCAVRTSGVQAMVCGDAQLRRLDRILAATYTFVLDDAPDRRLIAAQHRGWRNGRRDACTDRDCLADAYQGEIERLESKWHAHRLREVRRSAAQSGRLHDKPFEGVWTDCQLAEGEKSCTTFTLLQHDRRICGMADYAWSDKSHALRFRAEADEAGRAAEPRTCALPGSDIYPPCEDARGAALWHRSYDELMTCNGMLLDAQPSGCFGTERSVGFSYRPLASDVRRDLMSQAWVRQCLAGQ